MNRINQTEKNMIHEEIRNLDEKIRNLDEKIAEFQKERDRLKNELERVHSDDDTDKYLRTTYFGKELLRTHSLDEDGTWEIKGEDTNPDMGGAHIQPHLCFVKGTLDKVIQYAVKLPRFYAWGAGGRIIKVEAKKIIEL